MAFYALRDTEEDVVGSILNTGGSSPSVLGINYPDPPINYTANDDHADIDYKNWVPLILGVEIVSSSDPSTIVDVSYYYYNLTDSSNLQQANYRLLSSNDYGIQFVTSSGHFVLVLRSPNYKIGVVHGYNFIYSIPSTPQMLVMGNSSLLRYAPSSGEKSPGTRRYYCGTPLTREAITIFDDIDAHSTSIDYIDYDTSITPTNPGAFGFGYDLISDSVPELFTNTSSAILTSNSNLLNSPVVSINGTTVTWDKDKVALYIIGTPADRDGYISGGVGVGRWEKTQNDNIINGHYELSESPSPWGLAVFVYTVAPWGYWSGGTFHLPQ